MAFVHADFLLASPNIIYTSLVDTVSRQITFTWSPVYPECPAIHYNILASNCGHCPTTTNHTNITCSDAPTKAMCTFAVQAINCDFNIGNHSKPITVLLKETSSVITNNTHCDTSVALACVFATSFMMSIISRSFCTIWDMLVASVS